MNTQDILNDAIGRAKALVPEFIDYTISVQCTTTAGLLKLSKSHYFILLRDKEGNYVASGTGSNSLQAMGEFVTNIRKWKETGEFQESKG